MIRRITEQTSLLLNSEKLQANQSINSIMIFRILQLAQYFAIIMEFEQNNSDNFHLNSIVVIFKAALLDYENIPAYLGYFSTMISLFFFLYVILLSCLNLNQMSFIKNTALIYFGTLPQYFCLLQLSIAAHSLLQIQNNLFEQLLGTLSIILIFIQSFLGTLLMRNIYQAQTLFCKDTTFLGLLSQIAKFLTILFYFYDSTNAFRLGSLVLALIWSLLEISDLIFNLPYSIGDNKKQFVLLSVRIMCTLFSIVKVLINFKEALELYQLILGIIVWYLSKQIFKLLIYTKCFNHFRSEIQNNAQIFFIKIILYLDLQIANGNSQHYQILFCNLLSLHNQFCMKNCQAKACQDLLECLISKMQSNEEEQIFLFKINYIAFVQKQYSLSLMKIKQYQIHNGHMQTWHFKLMVLDIKNNIEEEIHQVLYNYNSNSNSKQYNYLTNQDLVHFEQQEIQLMPQIIKLVQLKIDIWQQQIRGFQNIYMLQQKLIDFSSQIDNIRTTIGILFGKDLSEISISLVNNIFHLRILSLYFSIIMNDQITSYLCEKQIQVVYYFEQTLKQNELTSLAIITDKISIVAVSLVKKQGEILNTNKQKIGSLFGYMKNNEYNTLLSVNQIIPDFISVIHNEMLTEFLKKGQSPFFVQFKQVFGKNKEYYIMPIQLQFSNDFSVMDDFVIKGVIYQGQKQQDFILFDDFGHIQGITQNLFEALIFDKSKCNKIDSQQLTKSFYIYYFIPQIFGIVQEFQKQKVNTQCVQFLEDTQFIVVQNLQEFHDDFSRSARKFTKHTMTDPALYASSYTNCSELTNNNIKTILRRKMFMEIDRSLLNDEFATSALKFIHNNIDIHLTYLIKFQLSYYSIQNEKVKGFYILEILDYRKHFDRKMDSEIVYRDADSTMKQSVKVQGIFSQRLVQQPEYDEVNIMQSNTNINLNTDDILRLDTNVNSSKRVIFLKPEIEQKDNDLILAEQSKSSSEEKGEDYLSPPLSKRQFCKENDSVQQIQNSEKNEKNKKHNLSEMEMAINQSQSSGVSRQSSRSSTYFNKLFQSKIVIYKNIKAVIVICSLTMVVNLYLCIYINIALKSNDQNLTDITNTMNIPLNLNRYFSKTATLSWINICANYSILDISQFQENQNNYQMYLISSYMFGNISELQLSLINTESQIPYIQQYQGLYPSENVKLTYFINYLCLQTKQILVATEISREYIQSLIILRYNVKNMFNITSYLMDNLQQQLAIIESQSELNQTLQIMINSFLMAILFGIQFIYLIKIQTQNQTLTLLVGRVKEQEVQNEIIKTQYLLTTLHKLAGNDSWKRINFWSFAFQNDNEYAFKKKLDIQKQTRVSNLNSRIKHMNITYRIILIKILVFLSFYLCYVWGFYALENRQSENIKPMITLDAQFVRYSVNVDLMIFSGLLIKTEQQLYQDFINDGIYSQEQIQTFDDGVSIILLFAELQSTFSDSMQSLFTDVISSMPTTASVTKMKNLIDQDICLTLGNEIPFCKFQNMSNTQFIHNYGSYETYDNDLDYLNKGILGIMAKQTHFYQQNYGYELDTLTFNPDLTQVESVFKLLDFNNIILSHFKDSYLAFVRFLNFLTSSISDIRDSNLAIQLIYLNCLGLLYFIVFAAMHYNWLSDSNKKMRSLKLSLVIIPYEQLFSGSIINVLRKIE